jgi:hypothetical protein
MTQRLPDRFSRDQDRTPWRDDGPVANSGLPATLHSLAVTGGAWLCDGCAFATRDPGEAAGHLAANQWVHPERRRRP